MANRPGQREWVASLAIKRLIKKLIMNLIGHGAAVRLRESLKYDPALLRFAFRRLRHKQPNVVWPQRVFSYELIIALDPKNLSTVLTDQGMCVHSGKHAAYIHEPTDIEKLSPGLSKAYPQPFGLKIFRSLSRSPDGSVYYTSTRNSAYTTPLAMWTVGSVREKLVVGNILHQHGIAPRVYDLVNLEHPDGPTLTALVTEHVGHELVRGDEGLELIERLRRVSRQEGIADVGHMNSIDILPPNFNDNIVRGSRGPVYVDIQKLVMLDAKRPRASEVGGGIHTSKKVGSDELGKEADFVSDRDATGQTLAMGSMLLEAGFEFHGARILDVGRELRQSVPFFLWKGAGHCLGIESPELVESTRRNLYRLGYSRFEVFSSESRCIGTGKNAFDSRPVDLMLIASNADIRELPEGLRRVEWEFLFCRGGENESVESTLQHVLDNFPGADVVNQKMHFDDHGHSRPMVLFRRKGS